MTPQLIKLFENSSFIVAYNNLYKKLFSEEKKMKIV